METDGKIYITISDERGTGGKGEIKPPSEKEKDNALKDYVTHQFFSLIKNNATMMANYTVGNIGNFTGDFNMQRHIDLTRKIASFGRNIGIGAIAGFKYGGGVGAIIGMTIATTQQAINEGLDIWQGYVANRQVNYSIDKLREISGMDSLTNGSR